jgi:hypothetical protein
LSWLPLFLDLFALGTAAAVAAVPWRAIGRYFFTFHFGLALAVAVLAALLGRPWDPAAGPLPIRVGSAVFAVALLAVAGLARAAKGELPKGALLLPVSVGVPFVAVAAVALTDYGTGKALLLAVHLLTAAGVLGTALVAMSTGHWYLANAALPFEILIRLCRLFLAALAAKAAVSAVYLLGRWEDYRQLEDFDLLVLAVRWIAGLVFAGALGGMALSCAKRKANQSATGILYVAVVFVLIGETISLYLTLGPQRPV